MVPIFTQGPHCLALSAEKKDLATVHNPPDEPFNDLTRPPGEFVHRRVIEGLLKVKPSEFTVYKSVRRRSQSHHYSFNSKRTRCASCCPYYWLVL